MANQARTTLEEQVAAFLSQGGEIQQVPVGATTARPKKSWAGNQKPAQNPPGEAQAPAPAAQPAR